jgi:hypothetical protein
VELLEVGDVFCLDLGALFEDVGKVVVELRGGLDPLGEEGVRLSGVWGVLRRRTGRVGGGLRKGARVRLDGEGGKGDKRDVG